MSKKIKRALPKTFRGAAVMRGLGMKEGKFEKLLAEKSLGQFDASQEQWLVMEEGALVDDPDFCVRGFLRKEDALRCARSLACGNVDQRVLRVTEQILVVATDNEL